ncbi:MAG: hypothetical protein WDN00_05255 [Limisphaerales bacterium]
MSTVPAPITSVVVGGNTLQLSWPADHTGWRLQVQTNGLDARPGSAWYDVDGSTVTNHVSLPIVPANPTVFLQDDLSMMLVPQTRRRDRRRVIRKFFRRLLSMKQPCPRMFRQRKYDWKK